MPIVRYIDAASAMQQPRIASLLGILIAIGLLTAVLHAGNLVFLARHFDCTLPSLVCDESRVPWRTPDSGGYSLVAEQIRTRGFLQASYLYRTPGYPLVLFMAGSVAGQSTAALWFACLLAGCAAVALAWMTYVLTESRIAAVISALLFCAWPNAFQYTPLLITDAVHAYVSVSALTATAIWWKRPSARAAALAAGLWMATQSIRPTFFPLPLILPLLFWSRSESARPASQARALWLASMLVPAFVVLSNFTHHRMWTVSVFGAETTSSFAIPRLEESLGLGTFKERQALNRAHYDRMGLGERVAAQRADALALMRSHPAATIVSLLSEFGSQLLWPLQPGYSPHLESLYPRWMSIPSGLMAIYWLSSLGGLILMMRSDARWALFLLALFGAVMVPATLAHLVGGRLRFPLDLFFMPVAVRFWHSVANRIGTGLSPSSKGVA